MKIQYSKLTIILLSLFICTGCFDLQENLYLKKDGSGNFSFIIDLTEMKTMMAMFDGEEEEQDDETEDTEEIKIKSREKSPNKKDDKFSSNFEKTRRKLLNTDGISNVKTIEDTINYKFGLSFDFKNITALNKAMNRLFEDEDTDTIPAQEIIYFEWKDKQLLRNEEIDSKSILSKTGSFSNTGGNDLFSGLTSNLEQLFAAVSYSANYEFEKKISLSSNAQAQLSSNDRKVSIKCYPFAAKKDTSAQQCTIANTISF